MRVSRSSAIKTNQLHVFFQVLLLIGFWLLGEIAVRMTHLPIPGGIAGMLIVLGLLTSRRLDVTWLRLGSEWLLAEMLLFFIPAVLVVLDHREFIGLVGLKILAVIVLGTILVMTITAFTVDIWQHMQHRPGGDHEVDRATHHGVRMVQRDDSDLLPESAVAPARRKVVDFSVDAHPYPPCRACSRPSHQLRKVHQSDALASLTFGSGHCCFCNSNLRAAKDDLRKLEDIDHRSVGWKRHVRGLIVDSRHSLRTERQRSAQPITAIDKHSICDVGIKFHRRDARSHSSIRCPHRCLWSCAWGANHVPVAIALCFGERGLS